MSLDADRLLATPDFHFLSSDGDSALFLPMDRDAYYRSSFLDRRIEALSETPVQMAAAPLVAAAKSGQAPRTGWIFHVAHCGSTLLSRLIDGKTSSLVLREPPPLRQLGVAAAAGDQSPEWNDRLKLAHAMVARRFDPNRPTVVKANVPVNFMLERLQALDGEAPAILLHFALEPYLTAILRSPQHRGWVERVTTQLDQALSKRVGPITGAAVAERAAALWLAQMLAFHSTLRSNPRAVSLDAEQLFDSPSQVGKAAADHLGVKDVDVDANAASLAGRYAKNFTRPYDERDRKSRIADDRARLGGEIIAARNWIDQCDAAKELPLQLARPLMGTAPDLLD